MDDPRSSPPPADASAAGHPAWLVILLVLLPLGGLAAAIAILLIGPPDGASDDQAARQASYPSPPPVTFVVPTPAPTATPTPGLVGQPMPHIDLTTLDGAPLELPEDAAGEIVFLNFWATWCAPCEAEMPALQQLEDTRGDEGVRVIAVTDPESGQTEADIHDFIERHDLSLTVALSSDLALYQTFNVLQIPVTYIIDGAGVVRYQHIGELKPEDIEHYVAELLA